MNFSTDQWYIFCTGRGGGGMDIINIRKNRKGATNREGNGIISYWGANTVRNKGARGGGCQCCKAVYYMLESSPPPPPEKGWKGGYVEENGKNEKEGKRGKIQNAEGARS
jgi:hypothetical protein